MTQLRLFNEQPEDHSQSNRVPSIDKFQGAMLLSTIGDALGWPTEFLDSTGRRTPSFSVPLTDFVEWQKLVGGKWWGYEDTITPGSYSDDTQLALAVARSINDTGTFEPTRFAYEELPLWLHYERGGGRSVKTAARKLIGKKADWSQNFYKQGDLDYKNAGANGAAMRNLPVALVNVGNEQRLMKDSFRNAIITHGHPRAILGAVLFGLATQYVLIATDEVQPKALSEYLCSEIEQVGKAVANDEHVLRWIHTWEKDGYGEQSSFRTAFNKVRQEATHYLTNIQPLIHSDAKNYYSFVEALSPTTKGSGLATVCVAIYLFLKYIDQPEEALKIAANTFGSDTDTIGVFLGGLLGAYHGLNGIPEHLLMHVQDRDYLLRTATRLHTIAAGDQREQIAVNQPTDRTEAYLRILAWEMGLLDMFWDALDIDDSVTHPTLGRGRITQKNVKPIKRDGYVAKLISVQFDCGQSCVFHSRVENNDRVSESLAQDIVKALEV